MNVTDWEICHLKGEGRKAERKRSSSLQAAPLWCVQWPMVCSIYLVSLGGPLSLALGQAAHGGGGGADEGRLGGLPKAWSWRVSTREVLMYSGDTLVSGGWACGTSPGGLCLEKCRQLGLGFELMSSDDEEEEDEEEGGGAGGVKPDQRKGPGGEPGG